MAPRLPLYALVSQVYVAFVVEFDNEFEHRVPHRTTNYGGPAGVPWLVSRVFWDRLLRFVPDERISVAELRKLTGDGAKDTELWLTRLSDWWGYLTRSDGLVRFTAGGRRAAEVWRPLTATIERRWEERFGVERIAELRRRLAEAGDPKLPGVLPILGYGLRTPAPEFNGVVEASLPALLGRVLYGFALDFEARSGLSLAIAANILRLLGAEGIAPGEISRLSGVSREAVATSVKYLKTIGLAVDVTGSRPKAVVLTAKGERVRGVCEALEWQEGEGLRECLEGIVGDARLREGMAPYPEGWRARVPAPASLPYYPMMLHRGGFPDGA